MPDLNNLDIEEELRGGHLTSPSSISRPIDNIPQQVDERAIKHITDSTTAKTIQDNYNKLHTPTKSETTPTTAKQQIIKGGGTYIAVVNNDQEDEAEITPWGSLNVKQAGLANGTVVTVTAVGDYLSYKYTPEDRMSSDYFAKVKDFQAKEQVAKAKFERARKLQELAQQADEKYINPENPTSFLDILIDMAHDTGEVLKSYEGKEDLFEREDSGIETFKRFIYESSFYRRKMYFDAHEYVQKYIKDPQQAIEDLLNDTTLTEREREFYAYEMVTKENYTTEDMIGQFGAQTLQNLGESMDWLANPVKASVMWLDARDGRTWSNQDDAYSLSNQSYLETLETCYRASWENEGRVAYNYDTGFLPFDMVLEFVSDPETWAKAADLLLGNKLLSNITDDLLKDEIVPVQSINNLDMVDKFRMRKALTSGDFEKIVAMFPEDSRAGVRYILNDMQEYKHLIDARKALGTFLDGKQMIDNFIANAVFMPLKLSWNLIKGGLGLAKDAINAGKSQAFVDAIDNISAKHGELTVAYATELIDDINLKIATINMSGELDELVPYLTKAEKEAIFTDLYAANPNAKETILKAMQRTGLEDTNLYAALSNSYQEFKDMMIEFSDARTPQQIADGHARLKSLIGDESVQAYISDTKIPIGNVDKAMSYKIESSLVADSYLDNDALSSLLETTYSNSEAASSLFARAKDSNFSASLSDIDRVKVKENRLIKDIIQHRTAIRNYEYITEAISNSTSFTKDEQMWLKDYMFNSKFQGKVKHCSMDIMNSDYNTVLQSRLLAQDWVKGAYKLDSIYNRAGALDFADLGNVYDFDNLKKIADDVLPKENYHTKYLYYTTSWDNDTVFLKFSDGAEFTLSRSASAIDDVAELDKYIVAMDPKYKLVGFNTHASGYDTDSLVQTICYKNHSIARNRFLNTIDMADILREQRGLPMITDAQITEAQSYIYQTMKNAQEDNAVAGHYVKSYYNIIPPSEDVFKEIGEGIEAMEPTYTKLVSADEFAIMDMHNVIESYPNPNGTVLLKMQRELSAEEQIVWDELKTIGEGINSVNKEISDAYISMYAEAGLDAVTQFDETVVSDIIKRTDGRLRTSEVWDSVKAKQWLTIDEKEWWGFDKPRLREWKNVVDSVDTARSGLKVECALIPEEYIDMLYNDLYSAVQSSPVVPMETKRMWSSLNLTSKEDRLAAAKAMWWNHAGDIPQQNGELWTGMFDNGELTALDNGGKPAAHWLLSNDMTSKVGKRYYNPYEFAPGVFGTEHNAWRTTQMHADKLRELQQGTDAMLMKEKYLADNNLSEAKVLTLDKARTVYSQLKQQVFSSDIPEINGDWMSKLVGNYQGGMYDASNFIKLRNGYQKAAAMSLTKMDADELSTFFWYANDHVIIDKNLDPMLNARLRKWADEAADIELNELDDALTVKYVGKRAEDFKANSELIRTIKHSVEGRDIFDNLRMSDADKFNGQFTTSSMLGNTEELRTALYSKYFPGEEIEDHGAFWFSSYLGDTNTIANMNTHISNDAAINITNGYSRAIRQEISALDQVKVSFKNSIPAQVTLSDSGKSMKWFTDNGYVCGQYLYDGKKLYMERCLPTAKNARIMSIETFNGLDKLCERATLEAFGKAEPNKVIKALNNYRGKMIATMLFTNPFTWIRNLMDSTIKGTLSEGTGHLVYLKKAKELCSDYNELHEAIVQYAKEHNYPYDDAVKLYFKDNYRELSRRSIFKRDYIRMDLLENSTMSLGLLEAEESRAITPIGKFNEKMFGKIENINRAAIFLKNLDEGVSVNKALHRIDVSQFEYGAGKTLTGARKFLPFMDFRLKNYDYWLNPENWNAMAVGKMTKMYGHDDNYYSEQFWSKEAMEYRAWIDTLDFERDDIPTYNNYTEIAAIENGWVRVTDNLYLKLGLSMTDIDGHLGVFARLTDDFYNLAEGKPVEGAVLNNLFTPVKTVLQGVFKLMQGESSLTEDFSTMATPEFIKKYGQTAADFLPVASLLISRLLQIDRNNAKLPDLDLTDWEKALLTLAPDGLALAQRNVKDYSDIYLTRAVGTNWYDLSDEDKDTLRYVMGMSYVPKWTLKDPATYIDTWGRMGQLGFTDDEIEKIMKDSEGFWFTPNGDLHIGALMQGTWAAEMKAQGDRFKEENPWTKLPKYQSESSQQWELKLGQILVHSEEVYKKLRGDLMSMGWSLQEAEHLLARCAKPTWRIKPYEERYDTSRINKRHAIYTGQDEAARGLISGQKHPSQWRLSDSLGLKRQPTVRQTRLQKTRYDKQNQVHWHKRQRDIYKDNYAKYGASRMAMNQNLKNYSNRSVTELHRTEQTLRYAQIHRHTKWFA